jgi:hypothetical protein
MYVNPFPFGVFIGVISTIVVEVIALVVIAVCKGDKDE